MTENVKDPNAVTVYNNKQKIGYIPRYYSSGISSMLENYRDIECKVYELNKELNGHECIKLVLNVL